MNNKQLMILGVVAVAAVGGYVLYKKHKAAQPASDPVAVNSPTQRNPGTPVNRYEEYVNVGRDVLDLFKKNSGGW